MIIWETSEGSDCTRNVRERWLYERSEYAMNGRDGSDYARSRKRSDYEWEKWFYDINRRGDFTMNNKKGSNFTTEMNVMIGVKHQERAGTKWFYESYNQVERERPRVIVSAVYKWFIIQKWVHGHIKRWIHTSIKSKRLLPVSSATSKEITAE